MFRRGANEEGSSLLELSFALPILVMALGALGFLCLWAAGHFRSELADWTMQEELRIALERIARDARPSAEVRIGRAFRDCTRVWFVRPRKLSDGHEQFVTYFADSTSTSTFRKVFRGSSYDPVTGDSIFGGVHITRFYCSMSSPAILRIELAGRSMATGHTFQLQTEVFLPEVRKRAALPDG